MSEPTREEMLWWLDRWYVHSCDVGTDKEGAGYDAIRRCIEQGKPKVSREFIKNYVDQLKRIVTGYYPQGQPYTLLKKMLREAGVEVEDE